MSNRDKGWLVVVILSLALLINAVVQFVIFWNSAW